MKHWSEDRTNIVAQNGNDGTHYDIPQAGIVKPLDAHYNNQGGSIYEYCVRNGLNAYEFDVIKRITRCRKKGQWRSDVEKTIRTLELYLKEFKE